MAFNLSEYVNLRYAVMLLGVVLFGVGFLMGWHEIRTVVKVLLVFGAIAFFVGFRYDKIYNTQGVGSSTPPGANAQNQKL